LTIGSADRRYGQHGEYLKCALLNGRPLRRRKRHQDGRPPSIRRREYLQRKTTINAGTLKFAKTASLYNSATASWTAANINVASGTTLALNVAAPESLPPPM